MASEKQGEKLSRMKRLQRLDWSKYDDAVLRGDEGRKSEIRRELEGRVLEIYLNEDM